MAAPQTAQIVPLGVPVGGMNVKDPQYGMDPIYSPWMYNVVPENQYIKVRNGWRMRSNLNAVAQFTYGLVSYENHAGVAELFAICGAPAQPIRVHNVTYPDWQAGLSYSSGTKVRGVTDHNIYVCATAIPVSATEPTGTGTGIADGAGTWDYVESALHYSSAAGLGEVQRIKYAGRTGFLRWATNESFVYAGGGIGVWSATGFTSGGGAISGLTSLTSYRGRVYLFTSDHLYYSIVGAVTGATTAVDLSSLMEYPGSIVWSSTLMDSTNKPTESLLAFGTTSGEIFVYGGSDPGAANWELIAKFKFPPPIGRHEVLSIGGDILIPTTAGLMSLRRAFQSGDGDVRNLSVSGQVDDYWKRLTSAYVYRPQLPTDFKCSLVFWPEQGKIYVLMRGHIREDGSLLPISRSTLFVMNTDTGAWAIHFDNQFAGSLSLTYFNGALYRINEGGFANVCQYDDTIFYDQNSAIPAAITGIPYAIHSTYLQGQRDQNRVVGFEPIMKTDFTGASVKMNVVADFGRRESAQTSNALSATGGYQNPFYACGVQGKHFQYRLEGDSDVASTQGLELYNVGVALK